MQNEIVVVKTKKLFLIIISFIQLLVNAQHCKLIAEEKSLYPKCYLLKEGFNETLNGLELVNSEASYQGWTLSKEQDLKMSPSLCVVHCADYFFKYAALKEGNKCYCGINISSYSEVEKEQYSNYCNLDCAVNSIRNLTDKCGGQKAYTIYNATLNSHYDITSSLNITKKLDLIDNLSEVDPRYLSCIAERPYCSPRIFKTKDNGDDPFSDLENMTVEMCISTCQSEGFKQAGLEAGTQCFCANEDDYNLSTRINERIGCTSSCGGNSSQICGGPWALSVYNATLETSINQPKLSKEKTIGIIIGSIAGSSIIAGVSWIACKTNLIYSGGFWLLLKKRKQFPLMTTGNNTELPVLLSNDNQISELVG